SLKCHSIMSFELAPGRGWIDRHRGKLFIRQPSAGGAFDFHAQALDQFWRALVRVHRIATQAWSITPMQRFVRRREKIDILSGRFFCRASGSAENSCCADADKKNAFKT